MPPRGNPGGVSLLRNRGDSSARRGSWPKGGGGRSRIFWKVSPVRRKVPGGHARQKSDHSAMSRKGNAKERKGGFH